ncbi:hypothetical protein PBI_SCTP2_269 [Salicola phage SCTP-2]|nr:hypothetical protein PBI_SCTP2_269 [Salicola phage SCTP-2]
MSENSKSTRNTGNQRRGNGDNNRRRQSQHLDELVLEALDFINKHADNKSVYKCFNKRNGALSTFGVYNYKTKKYSIHHTTNFYPDDLMDIKLVTLEKST